ncbi:MAG: hypothetical protein R6V85_05120 [Polyangia bacterium]
MKWISICAIALVCAFSLLFAGCGEEEDEEGAAPVVEKVEGYKPNLPVVPNIPKPDVPETYSDGSYSVYGLRKNMNETMDEAVTVTAYVADIYEKPQCPEGKTCHTLMPHLFLADKKDEILEKRYLKLVGYAQSFKEMEDEKANDEKGKEQDLPEGVYLAPVVWDWREGHKYKITGRFTRESGSGFKASDGLLEYGEHECLDCPEEDEEDEEDEE